MVLRLHEPALARPGGFFSFVYHALLQAGARLTDAPRPLPRLTVPRDHASAWIDLHGIPVLLDMSDHVFLYDLDALRHCALYFKTNLHLPTLHRVLAEAECPELATKVRPFFSFAGHLRTYLARRPLYDAYGAILGRRHDVCDVVGVYEHLRRDGETSPFSPGGPEPTPSRVHYWARVHTLEALRDAGLTGTLRLTSRYNDTLVDHTLIYPNLSQPAYRRAILRSRLLVINTLPHALLPWKATEAIALARPFVTDIPPLTEFPTPFLLIEGEHFLSLLPPADFHPTEPGRVLHRYSLDDFRAGAERLRSLLRDPARLRHMNAAVRDFRNQALRPQTLVRYLLDEAEALR